VNVEKISVNPKHASLPKLELRLLGPPQISLQGVVSSALTAAKAQALLYYLAMTAARGQPSQTRAALATLLWSEHGEGEARGNLRKVIQQLRKHFAPYLSVEHDAIGFQSDQLYGVDALEFMIQLSAARHAADPALLQQAVALYQGDFLEGFYVREAPVFEAWMLAERVRLRELMLQGLDTLASCYVDRGDLTQSIAALRRLLELEPWREETHRQVMQALAQTGDRAAALLQFENCRKLLAEELAVEPGSATLELVAQIRNGEFDRVEHELPHLGSLSPSYPVLARPKYNLPAQTTPLIGREQELTELAHLLADPAIRLVTILSAGGMGKTHLAVATASNHVEHFADGVCWVGLAPLTEANEMVYAIASALGLQLQGERTPEQQVGDFLQAKHLLLVLDNFEHLMEGAPFISDLLATAPQLSILVTSRQRLKLSSETVVLLDGLRFPTHKNADALDYPAVQLFLQHARRIRRGYQPDEQDLAGIVEICRLVNGMPLGILLAAAWTGVISPAEIAAEIGHDLSFLQSDLQDIPMRQRNLRAVFLHTWSRLSTAERAVFMRLSVFRGGSTREAAHRVTGAPIDVLAALNDKALLWRLPNGRYELHELLRQFAAEQLAADDADRNETQRQAQLEHSRYYLTLLAEQEGPLQGQQQRSAVDSIRADFENISVAWRWAVHQREFALLAPAVHALFLYCEVRGSYREGITLFAQATVELTSAATTSQLDLHPLLAQVLVRLGACEVMLNNGGNAVNALQQGLRYITTDQERAFALAQLGHAEIRRGEIAPGVEKVNESLALSRQCGDLSGVARALHARNWYFPDFTEAIHNCEESLTLWREVGRPDRIAEVLSLLAWHTCCRGDYETANAYWEENMTICITLGMQYNIAWILDCQGWIAWCQSDLATAQKYLQDAASLYHKLGMFSGVAMCQAELALVLRSVGDMPKAVQLAREAVALVRDTGDQMMLVLCLNYLGATLIGSGDVAGARHTLSEAIRQVLPTQHTAFLLNTLYYFAELLVLESHNDDLPVAFERKSLAVTVLSCVRTQTATWQIFKDKAAQLQAEIESALPAEMYSIAVRSGQSCTLEEIVRTVLGEEADALFNNIKYAV
jgi:DNA-binding SARP family transcriptional activator/predicted ATPase